MFLTAAAIIMFFYGFYELISWVKWLRQERGGPEEIPEENIITDLRKKYWNGYNYTSPTKSEDYENDSFEWDVHSEEVVGEVKKINKIIDYDED
jgi:hypothetical protein